MRGCVRVRACVCVRGWLAGWLVGWCRGSQPVEEPLAPDISTGLADHSYYRSPLLLQHRSVVEARTRSDVWTGGARSSRDPLLLSPHPPVHRADLTPTTRFSLFFFFLPAPIWAVFPPLLRSCVCVSLSPLQGLFSLQEREKKRKKWVFAAHWCSGSSSSSGVGGGERSLSVPDGRLEGRLGAGEVSAGRGRRRRCREISPDYPVYSGQCCCLGLP